MDDRVPADLVAMMVVLSMVGDAQGAGDVLQVIADSRPTGDMYPVCCAVADIGREVMLRMVGGSIPEGAYWGLLATGAGVVPPDIEFAHRFLVAYANGDEGMCLALYRERESAPGYGFMDSVITLVIQVGILAKP